MRYFILGFCLVLVASVAFASDPHHTYPAPVQTITHETTIIQRVEEKSSGMALSLAHAGLQFDPKEEKLQWAIGGGSYNSSEGIAFGLAKRSCCVLYNLSVGTSEGKTSVGIGLSGTF